MQTVRYNRWQDRSTLTSSEKAQKQRFFETLLNALRPPSFGRAPTYGTFAAVEVVKPAQGFSLQCFHVEGAGELQLPLSAQDTLKLRSVCEQAPFGKGLSTAVDNNAHCCWQVDASKVTFPGAPILLSDTIQTLAMKAVSALGLDGAELQLEAHFCSLLLYEAGAHFTFHRDSKKERGIFGSLILQLPTEEGCTGGKFLVKHNKERQEFDCHMVSAIGFCYTVFFADCRQAMQLIKSGTRLCLAFNLVKRFPLEPIHKMSMSGRLERVESVLEPWLKEATAERPNVCGNVPGGKFAIPLQHKYTEENLSFAGLKGDDIIVAEVLKECKNHSLDLHLCIVTKREVTHVSSNGYCSLEAVEEHFEFGNWIGLDDEPVDLKLRLDMEKEVVGSKEKLFDSEPYHIDTEAHVGSNGGETLEYGCDTAMLVAWPKAYSVSIATAFPVGSGQCYNKRQRLDTDVTEDAMKRTKNSKIDFIDLTQ